MGHLKGIKMSLKEDINYSLWCDFIERDFLENRFKEIIKKGIIQGATSNPAIFESSISNSVAYKQLRLAFDKQGGAIANWQANAANALPSLGVLRVLDAWLSTLPAQVGSL